MNFKIYDSYSNKLKDFKPNTDGKVSIYACGVTVYDHCHIGHIRQAVNFDTIVRFFRTLGYETVFVKNYTDIDDKIIIRAQELGIPWNQLSEDMIREHDSVMDIFRVEPPSHAPKATEFIDEIIEMSSVLIEKGFAYASEGDVYFRVSSFDEYGKLSGKKIEDLIPGFRVDVRDSKSSEADFALWKAQKPGEPAWDSPWGPGRPGWHIECSAMAGTILGENFDIHGGGSDLIFPHHENEIAQSTCCFGKPPANYWLHNGMVRIEGKKMSKSLNNFIIAAELAEKFNPEGVRFYIQRTQYRQTMNFSEEHLTESIESLDRLYEGLAGQTDSFEQSDCISPDHPFMEAMMDDFNTAKAIGVLFEMLRKLNSLEANCEEALHLAGEMKAAGKILGIFNSESAEWFSKPRIDKGEVSLSDEEVEGLISERNAARKAKDFSKSDALRDQLLNNGIKIKDEKDGTTWIRV